MLVRKRVKHRGVSRVTGPRHFTAYFLPFIQHFLTIALKSSAHFDFLVAVVAVGRVVGKPGLRFRPRAKVKEPGPFYYRLRGSPGLTERSSWLKTAKLLQVCRLGRGRNCEVLSDRSGGTIEIHRAWRDVSGAEIGYSGPLLLELPNNGLRQLIGLISYTRKRNSSLFSYGGALT